MTRFWSIALIAFFAITFFVLESGAARAIDQDISVVEKIQTTTKNNQNAAQSKTENDSQFSAKQMTLIELAKRLIPLLKQDKQYKKITKIKREIGAINQRILALQSIESSSRYPVNIQQLIDEIGERQNELERSLDKIKQHYHL